MFCQLITDHLSYNCLYMNKQNKEMRAKTTNKNLFVCMCVCVCVLDPG